MPEIQIPVVFENEETQKIYNICKTICEEIGIQINEVKDYVLQNTLDSIDKHIDIKSKYDATATFLLEKKNIKSLPYEVYKDRMMFWFLSCSLLIAIQTKMPSFESRNARKFDGYPLTGIENESPLKYLSEVLYKLKNNIEPWNSIEKVNKKSLEKNIKNILEQFFKRNDIDNLYKQNVNIC